MKVHHIAITARDVPGLARFYEDVLGLKLLKENKDDAGIRSIWLDLDGSILMIERSDRSAYSPAGGFHDRPPGIYLVALQIHHSEFSSWIERLAQHKVPVVYMSDYTLYIMDPERNRIGLSFFPLESASNETPAEKPPQTGR